MPVQVRTSSHHSTASDDSQDDQGVSGGGPGTGSGGVGDEKNRLPAEVAMMLPILRYV